MLSDRAATVLLWASPAIITLAAVGFGVAMSSLRAGTGAMRSTGGVIALCVLIILVVHAGYFAGPFALGSGRRWFVLALMLPAALLALVLAAVALASEAGRDILGKIAPLPVTLGAAVLLGSAYVAPLLVLMAYPPVGK